MTAYPWFRVYNEVLTDRKLERIRRISGAPRVIIRGVWLTIMAMANDSPERGCLLFAEGVPVTMDDLCDDLEMDLATLEALMQCFEQFGMVHQESSTFVCTNWDKRQFKSDNRSSSHTSEWDAIREVVFMRDEYRCQYCGNRAEHIDHIVPRCQGGSNELTNLVAACASCNCTKGGRTPEQAEMTFIEGPPNA